MAYETVRYDVAENGVATIALDRPEARNALSDALLDDLLAAFAAARDDDAVRCVVLTSTHEKVFSAGGDLGAFAGQEPLVHKHFGSERFLRLFQRSASSASRRCAPPTVTCSPARSASRWPAT